MKNFEGFGLSDALNISLSKMNYTTPTPIQAQAIPLALKGHDILGSAQTGTGKTAAFSIPLVESLLRSPHGCALVLTPTRELAKQVLDVIHQLLGRESAINTAFIIGGEHMGKQLSQLKRNPRIIVGTPGRINDHLERGTLKLNETGFLVLDETDRMLDMGFGVQLDRIVKFLPQKRQTLMFSATLPDGIISLSSKYLTNPERVSMGETNVIATNIKQEAIRIEQGDKYKELLIQLHERTGSVIIFVKTKHNADKMAHKLRQDGFTSEGLHGDLRQNKRDKVMKNFRNDNFRILVATDIAARGLDVPHIEHVINYDLPQVAEDYIHRMGRTARAGAKGSALSFVSPADGRKWHAIERLLDPTAAASNDRGSSSKQGQKPRRSKPFNKGNGKPNHNRSGFEHRNKSKDERSNTAKPGAQPHHTKKSNDKPRDDKPQRSAEGKPQKSYVKAYKPGGKPAGAPSRPNKKYGGGGKPQRKRAA